MLRKVLVVQSALLAATTQKVEHLEELVEVCGPPTQQKSITVFPSRFKDLPRSSHYVKKWLHLWAQKLSHPQPIALQERFTNVLQPWCKLLTFSARSFPWLNGLVCIYPWPQGEPVVQLDDLVSYELKNNEQFRAKFVEKYASKAYTTRGAIKFFYNMNFRGANQPNQPNKQPHTSLPQSANTRHWEVMTTSSGLPMAKWKGVGNPFWLMPLVFCGNKQDTSHIKKQVDVVFEPVRDEDGEEIGSMATLKSLVLHEMKEIIYWYSVCF